MAACAPLARAAERVPERWPGPAGSPFTITTEQVTKLRACVYAGRVLLLTRAFLKRKPFWMEKMMARRKELPREGKKTLLILDQQLLESTSQMETKDGKKNLMEEPAGKRCPTNPPTKDAKPWQHGCRCVGRISAIHIKGWRCGR